MNTVSNTRRIPYDIQQGKTSTEKLSRENFGLIAMQCLLPKPIQSAPCSSKVGEILSETAERTLKQLYPRMMAILWAMQPTQMGNGEVDWEYLYQEATEQYCKSPEFLKRFKSTTGVEYDVFKRDLLNELRKTLLYDQLQFKELSPSSYIQKTQKRF